MEPPTKRIKIADDEAAPQSITTTVYAVRGENIGTVTLNSSASGRELVRRVRTLHGFPLRNRLQLFHGMELVQQNASVGQQGLDGASLQLVASPIDPHRWQELQLAAAGLIGPGTPLITREDLYYAGLKPSPD